VMMMTVSKVEEDTTKMPERIKFIRSSTDHWNSKTTSYYDKNLWRIKKNISNLARNKIQFIIMNFSLPVHRGRKSRKFFNVINIERKNCDGANWGVFLRNLFLLL
jgi:hypothetical protein